MACTSCDMPLLFERVDNGQEIVEKVVVMSQMCVIGALVCDKH